MDDKLQQWVNGVEILKYRPRCRTTGFDGHWSEDKKDCFHTNAIKISRDE